MSKTDIPVAVVVFKDGEAHERIEAQFTTLEERQLVGRRVERVLEQIKVEWMNKRADELEAAVETIQTGDILDDVHPEPCWYTLKATPGEILYHYVRHMPPCEFFECEGFNYNGKWVPCGGHNNGPEHTHVPVIHSEDYRQKYPNWRDKRS